MAMPTYSTRTYPDDYIEHWGEIFIQHRMDIALGITFEQFLHQPGHYMVDYHALLNSPDHLDAVAARISENEYLPPTVQQARVRERIYTRRIKDAINRTANGHATVDDAELLERAITAAREIRHVPRQDNGKPVEKMRHHRHPNSNPAFRGGPEEVKP